MGKVRLITIGAQGQMSADLVPQGTATRSSTTGWSCRPREWARLAAEYGIDFGTPIIRFDKAAWGDAVEFGVRGPMPDPSLPPGTISRLTGDLVHGVVISDETVEGEDWHTIGMFSRAALDVYLDCARQAHIPVEFYGEHDDTSPMLSIGWDPTD